MDRKRELETEEKRTRGWVGKTGACSTPSRAKHPARSLKEHIISIMGTPPSDDGGAGY
jgi:hypothetical protein